MFTTMICICQILADPCRFESDIGAPATVVVWQSAAQNMGITSVKNYRHPIHLLIIGNSTITQRQFHRHIHLAIHIFLSLKFVIHVIIYFILFVVLGLIDIDRLNSHENIICLNRIVKSYNTVRSTWSTQLSDKQKIDLSPNPNKPTHHKTQMCIITRVDRAINCTKPLNSIRSMVTLHFNMLQYIMLQKLHYDIGSCLISDRKPL